MQCIAESVMKWFCSPKHVFYSGSRDLRRSLKLIDYVIPCLEEWFLQVDNYFPLHRPSHWIGNPNRWKVSLIHPWTFWSSNQDDPLILTDLFHVHCLSNYAKRVECFYGGLAHFPDCWESIRNQSSGQTHHKVLLLLLSIRNLPLIIHNFTSFWYFYFKINYHLYQISLVCH